MIKLTKSPNGLDGWTRKLYMHDMDEILEKMREREKELEAELQKLRRAREIYERGTQGELFPRPSGRTSRVEKSTIKQEVMKLLCRYPDGLIALDILEELNKTTRPGMPREVLSPQLSRLKQEGKLTAKNGVWRLADIKKSHQDIKEGSGK